jgi:hypothetical protein
MIAELEGNKCACRTATRKSQAKESQRSADAYLAIAHERLWLSRYNQMLARTSAQVGAQKAT